MDGATATHALVGRTSELNRLDELLAMLGQKGALVQAVGEAGIGKSRLLEELLGRATERGYLALSGRASEFEADVPFSVWVDALGATVREMEAEQLDQVDEPYRRELAAVFPTLAPADAVPLAALAATERFRLHRGIAVLLATLAADRPLVLALDDLHWADSASIEVLLHLIEHPPGPGVLLALGYRPRQLRSGLARALEDTAQRAGERLELKPLSLEETTQLLPPQLAEPSRRHLFELSGGNPFYLDQLLRATDQGEPPAAADRGSTGTVPAAVASATARELATLSEQARRVLEGAAVAGDRFDPALAAAAAEISRDQVLPVIDELAGRDIVRSTNPQPADGPERFRFRHPLLHRAVYQEAPAAWRLGAHARVARALADRGAPPAVRAHHIEQFAEPGDSEAVDVLQQAAEAAAPHAPSNAADWYQGALRLLPANPDQAQRRRALLLGAGMTLGLAGRLSESSATFRQLLDQLPPGSPERTAVVRFAALAEHLLGNHEQAKTLVLRQLEALPADGSEARQLEIELAYGGFITADWDSVRTWATMALKGELSDTLRAAALSLRALAEYAQGEPDAARASAAAARELVDALEDVALLERLEAISVLAWAELCLEDVDRSLAHAGRGIAISQEHGQQHLIVAIQVVQALGLLLKGAFGRAAEVAQDAIESTRLSANKLFETWALTTRCDVELQAGHLRAAVELGEQAQQAAAGSGSPWAGVAVPYMAEAWLEAGEPQRCLNTMLDPSGRPRLPPSPYYAPRCYETLVRAELRLGRRDRAAGWAAEATAAGEQIGLAGARCVAKRAEAEVALAQGEPERALTLAREGAELAESAMLAVAAARCRLTAGRALASIDRTQAAAELRRAHSELSQQGATRYRDRAASELRRLRRTAAPRSPTDPAGGLERLSSRQREIAELVASDRTNREIAEQLGLKTKTIGNHLNHMFRRLGLNSRAELAALVDRDRDP